MDLYLLTVHEPYEDPRTSASRNVTIVPAETLLHPEVPQPDGGRLYRCVTDAPGRAAWSVVPMSTLKFEAGQHAAALADWGRVTATVVDLARRNGCDSQTLGLHPRLAELLAAPPGTIVNVPPPDGPSQLGPEDRQSHLEQAAYELMVSVGSGGRLWPGEGLVDPPAMPDARSA